MNKRDTEKQRIGDSENRRARASNATQESQEVPPLAACVNTLPEAAQCSLKDGLQEDSLFIFSRALKAFEITTKRRLTKGDLEGAFATWWNLARKYLPADADFDECRMDFEATYAKTTSALGSDSLQAALERATARPLPPQATRYNSPLLRRLVAVCYHLQTLQGDSPFFLSVRAAAKVMGLANLNKASSLLSGLVRDGILTEVEKGQQGGRRATRYRFN